MKSTYLLFCFMACVMLSYSQEILLVPELSVAQEKEVLYQHVISYALIGVDFAKSQGVTPEAYGSYVGEQFKMFWNPDDGLEVFASRMMYILAGLHPANELELLEQGPERIRFRLKNVDLPFKEGPAFGITYKEYLAFSKGVISALAEYLGLEFTHTINGSWYEVTVTANKLRR